MAKYNDSGKAGEDAAVTCLEQKEYLIRDRNWRKGHFGLDIVAVRDNELIVVEMETRSNTLFAEPEGTADLSKIRRAVRTADACTRLFQVDLPIRSDTITAVGNSGHFKVEYIEEVFYPPLYQRVLWFHISITIGTMRRVQSALKIMV